MRYTYTTFHPDYRTREFPAPNLLLSNKLLSMANIANRMVAKIIIFEVVKAELRIGNILFRAEFRMGEEAFKFIHG